MRDQGLQERQGPERQGAVEVDVELEPPEKRGISPYVAMAVVTQLHVVDVEGKATRIGAVARLERGQPAAVLAQRNAEVVDVLAELAAAVGLGEVGDAGLVLLVRDGGSGDLVLLGVERGDQVGDDVGQVTLQQGGVAAREDVLAGVVLLDEQVDGVGAGVGHGRASLRENG